MQDDIVGIGNRFDAFLKSTSGVMAGDEIPKLYYSIGEVSDMVGQEPHVLRYWESEFDVLSPRKNRAGRRVYTAENVETVRRIQRLLKEEKYTIAGARQAIARQERGFDEQAFQDTLREMRMVLEHMKEQLQADA